MISKKLVLVLSLCAAGSLASLQAAPVDCASEGGGNLQTILTTNGGLCKIGAYTFNFQAFTVIGATSNTTPVGGLTAADVILSDLLNVNGTGFLLTPTSAWAALGGGSNTDSELKFVVTGTGITSNYLEVDGSAVPNAFDHVEELFCLGGTVPGQSSGCNAPGGAQSQLDAKISGSGTCAQGSSVTPTGGGPTACGTTLTFAAQTSISVLKDIDVNGGPGGGSGDKAQINGVINQFGPAVVPEPGTYLLSAIGLGLLFLGKRKYSSL